MSVDTPPQVVHPNRDVNSETNIVWLEPIGQIEKLDYVREYTTATAKKSGKPPRWTGKLYGYAELAADTEPAFISHTTPMYKRRVFTLKETDRGRGDQWPHDTDAPAEAVDPRLLEAGSHGVLTERAKKTEVNDE